MKYNYSHISQIIVLVLLLFSYKSFCQNGSMQTINTSGNDIYGNSGSVAYSIGQVFYSYSGNNTYQINEGIQQVQATDVEANPNNNEDSDLPDGVTDLIVTARIYPNPTTDYVNLSTEGFDFNNKRNVYQLYNYQGKLLKQSLIENQNTSIDLSYLSSSIYILQIFAEEKLLKTFKIVKK